MRSLKFKRPGRPGNYHEREFHNKNGNQIAEKGNQITGSESFKSFLKNNRSFPTKDDFFPGNGQESLNLNPMGRSVPY
jgi:hypothetical protein